MLPNTHPVVLPSAEPAYPSRAVAWYATIFLAFLYWFSILDRTIISLMVDPIKSDLGISDLQFGVLHGAAFAIAFSVFGLIAGVMADHASRRTVIFFGVAVWSLATAACGLAQNFWHLLIARIGIGTGEAALNPSATSMITDLFPPQRLTSAMAVYAIGASAGSGCAYLFGGLVVGLLAERTNLHVPFLGELRSWQAIFLMIGIPGALMSFLLFTIPEPVRRGRLARSTSHRSALQTGFDTYTALFKFIRSRARFFLFHYSGFTFASIVLIGPAAWYPAHMSRNFGWKSAEIGFWLGMVVLVGGFTGKMLCGFSVDALHRRGFRDAQLRWFAGCLLAATPIGIAATLSDSPWYFLGGIGLCAVLLSGLPACAMASLNLVTPNEMRGSGAAIFGAIGGVFAASTGPLIVAGFSDRLFGGGASIGLGMAMTIGLCCPIAAALLLCGLTPMRTAAAAKDDILYR